MTRPMRPGKRRGRDRCRYEAQAPRHRNAARFRGARTHGPFVSHPAGRSTSCASGARDDHEWQIHHSPGAPMQIDFRAFSADCLIMGKLDLTAPRLTDMLNAEPTLHLTEVVLEALSDGHRLAIPDYTLHRDEIYAVKVTGPRGSKALRIVTVPHRVQAQIGPYNVLGRLNAAPGIDALRTIPDRGVMLPLTDATIAYVVGGILEVRDASTAIINRELASWVRAADRDEALSGATHSRVGDPAG